MKQAGRYTFYGRLILAVIAGIKGLSADMPPWFGSAVFTGSVYIIVSLTVLWGVTVILSRFSGRLILQLFCLIILTGWPMPASACNNCTMAFFDYILPPVFVWQFFAVAWFLVTSAVCDEESWGFPNTGIAVMIGVSTIVFGWAFSFGPILSLALIFPPVILAINTANKNARKKWGETKSKIYTKVSVLGLIVLAGLLSFSVRIHCTRTTVEYLNTWEGTGQTLSIIKQLKTEGADINEIRLIVSKGKESVSTKLAATLAVRGDPATDFPILLDVLKRSRREQWGRGSELIESAIFYLTALEMPSGTSIDDWKKAFNQLDTPLKRNPLNLPPP
ncbi:MAG: hypothetical protein GY795_17150 [Desulfobacterales bacterium]|nr:hypothetical protein [Desulfobacterales bacterium]